MTLDYLARLRKLFNERYKGSAARVPHYILLGPSDFAVFQHEMDEWFDNRPFELRFVTRWHFRQPMFKGAYVFGYGVDGVEEFIDGA